MSADDFQSKYASVMESMLKSAIAETTKLFENMVDELKAEISQIRKENEDLKTRCSQYETAKTSGAAESLCITETSDASEKCDTAVQCDLVRCRAILVEECEPLMHKELKRQGHQYICEWDNHSIQEHDYVTYKDRTSQMEVVVVKQESQLKQEEDDPDVAGAQVLANEIGSFGASVGEAQNGGQHLSNSSNAQLTVPQKNKIPLVVQLPFLEIEELDWAQNHSTDMQHAIVISLKDALRDNIKEEDVFEMVEMAKQQRVLTSENDQMVPQTCHRDRDSTHKEPTPLKSASVTNAIAAEELNEKVQKSVANCKPNSSLGRKRGRPPNKKRPKQVCPRLTQKTKKFQVGVKISAGKELDDPISPLPTSSVNNILMKNGRDPTLENKNAHVESVSSSFLSGEQPALELQECCPEVGKEATANKTAKASLDVPPQASSGLLKACPSAVSLQDAMLLVEAMNQTTMEKNVSPSKFSHLQMASSSINLVDSLKTVVENLTVQKTASVETLLRSAQTSSMPADVTAATSSKLVDLQSGESQRPSPLDCTASSPCLSSTSATRTVIQSLPLPLVNGTTPTKGPRTIIILPRPSLSPESAKAMSQSRHSPVNPALLKKSNLPPSTKALPHEKPAMSSITEKNFKVVYRKQAPIESLKSSTIQTEHRYVAPQTITIVSKAITPLQYREAEPIALAANQNNNKVVAPVPPESTKQLMSQLKESYSGNATLSDKTNDATHDLNPSEQISSAAENTISGSKSPACQVQVSSAILQTAGHLLIPVVKLTRLPLSISTKESVLISTLSKGLIQGMSSSFHVSEEAAPLTSDSEQDILFSDDDYEQEDATITHNDASDPHVQMSKAQFLAKLAVSPLETKSTSDEASNVKENKSIVSRLRSHLQAHFEAKRSLTKQVAEKEMKSDKNLKKPGENIQDSIEEQTNITCMHRVSAEQDNFSKWSIPSEESSVCFKKTSSARQIVGSEKMIFPFEITIQSSSLKEIASMKITKSTSVCPKRPPSDGDDTISEIKTSSSLSPNKRTYKSVRMIANDSTPKTTKCSSSPKVLTRLYSSLEKTQPNAGENSGGPEMPVNPSVSTSPKCNSRTKSIKREYSSFTPRRYVVNADNSITETTRNEPYSSSPKFLKTAKDDSSPQMDGEPNPTKPKQLQGHRGQKTNYKVISARKLTSAAKGRKRVGKKRGSYKKKLELPVIQSGVVGKFRAKVWYPPTLPPNEKPMIDIIRPPPQKVEYRVPNIPLSAPPIVSPLQPLAVIGRHLLRNQCGECGRVFSNSNALESHVSLHKIYRPFSCKLCGKYFPDSRTFKRHDRVHRNGRIHVCQHCGKGFVYSFGLSKHIQMVHGRIRPFICQVCGNGFYTKRDVEIHVRIHTGEKPFQCHICERRFTRKVELNVHLRWHNGEKRHWCQYCGKGFLDYNNLKRHRYTHTGEKPYSCPHCPKHFTQTGHLKKHVNTVHKKLSRNT